MMEVDIESQAAEIVGLVISEDFGGAMDKWKAHTAGKTSKQIISLRDSIREIESRIVFGLDMVENSETGPL